MMILPIITGYYSTLQNNKSMKLTDKRFWIREIALTVALSAMPLTMYGESIRVIMLIVASYAVVAGISVISVPKPSVFATWALIFCAANGAYIIDLIIIDNLRLIQDGILSFDYRATLSVSDMPACKCSGLRNRRYNISQSQ